MRAHLRLQNPIPRTGKWEEISGDDFLRKLLCMVRPAAPRATPQPFAQLRLLARCQGLQTIANPYTGDTLTIDPRSLAQRILEARARRATRANVRATTDSVPCCLRAELAERARRFGSTWPSSLLKT